MLWQKNCLYYTQIQRIKMRKLDALIVEDEIDICYLLSGMLKKRSLYTSYVTNIHDAYKILETNPPNILFLDNHLPDGKGVDFLSAVRATYPSMSIIMISAHDTNEDKQKALQNGADLFISKPFTMELINEAMDKFLIGIH